MSKPIAGRADNWGYDGWFGPQVQTDVGTAAALLTGEDTIGADIPLLDGGLAFYGSYVDNFGGFDALKARFGDCPVQGHPWVYTNAANMQAVIDAMGNRPFVRFSAHFGQGPHVCGPKTCGFPQADVTQWDDRGPHGQNVDQWIMHARPAGITAHPYLLSLTVVGSGGAAQCADVEPGGMSVDALADWYDNRALHGQVDPPKPADNHHYEWFNGNAVRWHGQKVIERNVVRRYDNHERTAEVHAKLYFLAERLATLAHREHPRLTVAQALRKRGDHSGWRFKELMRRYHGIKGH